MAKDPIKELAEAIGVSFWGKTVSNEITELGRTIADLITSGKWDKELEAVGLVRLKEGQTIARIITRKGEMKVFDDTPTPSKELPKVTTSEQVATNRNTEKETRPECGGEYGTR